MTRPKLEAAPSFDEPRTLQEIEQYFLRVSSLQEARANTAITNAMRFHYAGQSEAFRESARLIGRLIKAQAI